MILKKQIIQSKTTPTNSNDLWLKDDKLYVNKGGKWVPMSEDPAIIEQYKDGKSTIEYKDKEGISHSIVTDNTIGDILKNNLIIKVTWRELKDLRDNGELTPGTLYRITDYQCVTTQENTRSAGHQFDIVLLALSTNKLAEEGWARMNENNVYDITFHDGVTKKCWVYSTVNNGYYNVVDYNTLGGIGSIPISNEEINEENKTIIFQERPFQTVKSYDLNGVDLNYNYFCNSDLAAWKVWYCLDNDTDKFNWINQKEDLITSSIPGDKYYRDKRLDIVVDGIKYFGWSKVTDYYSSSNFIYTKTEIPQQGTLIYNQQLTQQSFTVSDFQPVQIKGVIYRLIDEFNNDCPYDFKNIIYCKSGHVQFSYQGGTSKYQPTGNTITESNTTYYEYQYILHSGSGNQTAWANNLLYAQCQISDVETGSTMFYKLGTNNTLQSWSTASSVNADIYDMYTFNGNDTQTALDASINRLSGVYNNKIIGNYNLFQYQGKVVVKSTLPTIILYGSSGYSDTIRNNVIYSSCQNIFAHNLMNSKIGDLCKNINIGRSGTAYCTNIYIGNKCENIEISSYSSYINIEDNCTNITFSKENTRFVDINQGSNNITITSEDTTSQYNWLQHLVISGVSNATITESANSSSIMTYVPEGSDRVEVSPS